MRAVALTLTVLCTACAGHAHLPGQPGAPNADLEGEAERALWLEAHPDVDPEIAEAIREGVFVPGMTLEHRDVLTNPDRRGLTGNGYWRAADMGSETRYRWYVAGEREPFEDGRGRPVCELVYREGALREVRYCPGGAAPTDGG